MRAVRGPRPPALRAATLPPARCPAGGATGPTAGPVPPPAPQDRPASAPGHRSPRPTLPPSRRARRGLAERRVQAYGARSPGGVPRCAGASPRWPAPCRHRPAPARCARWLRRGPGSGVPPPSGRGAGGCGSSPRPPPRRCAAARPPPVPGSIRTGPSPRRIAAVSKAHPNSRRRLSGRQRRFPRPRSPRRAVGCRHSSASPRRRGSARGNGRGPRR